MDAPLRPATDPPSEEATSASVDGGGGESRLERFESLDDAMRVMGVPLENHRFFRQFTAAIGVAKYYRTSSYIKAVRIDNGPALQIAFGYTNGFLPREEALNASGNTEPWPSARDRSMGTLASCSRAREPRIQS